MKDEYTAFDFIDIGLCIIDEAHIINCKVFSKTLSKLSTKYVLCLSATPDRKDGL